MKKGYTSRQKIDESIDDLQNTHKKGLIINVQLYGKADSFFLKNEMSVEKLHMRAFTVRNPGLYIYIYIFIHIYLYICIYIYIKKKRKSGTDKAPLSASQSLESEKATLKMFQNSIICIFQ